MNYTDEELQSEDDADSLIGDNDSLMGDAQPQPILPVMQMSTIATDDFHDDETEDELASSELEWPTPRKAWPKPNTATPLSHTPWHSSPLKPVYSSKSPIDPAWRAPPLPKYDELRGVDSPVGSPTRHEADDLCSDRSVQKHPVRASGPYTLRQRPASIMSPLDHMKSLDRRKWRHAAGNPVRPRSVQSMKLPRWTKAEENLLRRLRTTTRLVFSEIKPYFPGRKTQAIKIHWSKMTRKATNPRPSYNSPRSGSAAVSSGRNSSLKHESNRSPANTGRRTSNSAATAPAPRGALNGAMDPLASAVPNLVLHGGVSSPEFKRQKTPSRCEREIPNSSDPTEELPGIRAFSLVTCTSRRAPAQSDCKTSPTEDVKEELHGEQMQRLPLMLNLSLLP